MSGEVADIIEWLNELNRDLFYSEFDPEWPADKIVEFIANAIERGDYRTTHTDREGG